MTAFYQKGSVLAMAFDGIVIANVKNDIDRFLKGGRVDKIYQPEKDEIIMNVRSNSSVYKLLLSANPSQPRVHFTRLSYDNPMQPPLFCMVLRKHLTSGKILGVEQPDFDRILILKIESPNEMGDYSTKQVIIEIMGRHSNIILVDHNGIVLDCAKHISFDTSSVRQVLPGKKYEFPPSQNKINPINVEYESFYSEMTKKKSLKIQEAIYKSYTGISPAVADNLCFSAGIDGSVHFEELNDNQKRMLFNSLCDLSENIKTCNFYPVVYLSKKNNKQLEFSSVRLSQLAEISEEKKYESISELLEDYYKLREQHYRMEQKTQDLRKIIMQNIERCAKKKDIYKRTFREIADRNKLRLFGELITANIYSIKKGMTTFTTQNFYSEDYSEITIPLDSQLTPAENAQKYFKKYNKEKRTHEALLEQVKTNDTELEYLESILSMLKTCENEQDIKEVRLELYEQGFIKRITKEKKGASSNKRSKPLHYVSSDGFDIYVGKNNHQNDELTLKFAKTWDMWFHTKNIPGSHVIVVTDNKNVPDSTLNEAAMLAAFYSKARESTLVPVDYTQKKYVKKPNGAKPGMVIYETNQTAYITPLEQEVSKIKTVK